MPHEMSPNASFASPDTGLPAMPPRDTDGHKGTFGTVLVVGGSDFGGRVMLGAPALVARAALRTGAGLAVIVAPRPIVRDCVALEPSATGVALPIDGSGSLVSHLCAKAIDSPAEKAAAAVIGPGMGDDPAVAGLALRLAAACAGPVVLDADALNALAQTPGFQHDLRGRPILTPHPGEFRRLAGALGVKGDPTNETERAEAATTLASRLGAVVVLKGARTIVSDGLRTHTSAHAVPALATGGTGDVLAGVIAGIAAQFVGPPAVRVPGSDRAMPGDPARPLSPWEAAVLGVEVHARAGIAWSRSHAATGGLLARELADAIPQAVMSLRRD